MPRIKRFSDEQKLEIIRNVLECDDIRDVLRDALQLGPRADTLSADTPLLGNVPELDSMAVVTVITALEEQYGFLVEDDEISAETFATLGSLTEFGFRLFRVARGDGLADLSKLRPQSRLDGPVTQTACFILAESLCGALRVGHGVEVIFQDPWIR